MIKSKQEQMTTLLSWDESTEGNFLMTQQLLLNCLDTITDAQDRILCLVSSRGLSIKMEQTI